MSGVAPRLRFLFDVGGEGVAGVDEDEVAEGHGLALFEGEVEGAGVGEEAEVADVPGLLAADVARGRHEGDAVGFVVDGAGEIAPGGGFGACGFFAAGAAGGDDDVVFVGGDFGGEADGAEPGLDALDVQGHAFEDGVGAGGGEFAGEIDGAGAVGIREDVDGAGFEKDGVSGVGVFSIPGEGFDEGVVGEGFEGEVALLVGGESPVVDAVDVAPADVEGAVPGVVGFLGLGEAPLVRSDGGAVVGEDRVEVGAIPLGVIGFCGVAVGGEGVAGDGDLELAVDVFDVDR